MIQWRLPTGPCDTIRTRSMLDVPPTNADAAPRRGPKVDDFIGRSAAEFGTSRHVEAAMALTDHPLVSVIMTTHDSARTIEKAVLSVLHQSWPNLEIVIADDCSTDSTHEVLQELRRKSKKCIRILPLATNVGTYLAKNIAIEASRGEILLFQDSDDYSHPDRVLVQALHLVQTPERLGNRTRYCRFNPVDREVYPVGDQMARYGFITLAVRRSVFQEIGYFDAVRRAGDQEWFERLKRLRPTKAIENIPVTLYAAELRKDSLSADLMTPREDGSIQQALSGKRQEYMEIVQRRLEDHGMDPEWFKAHFPPMPRRPEAVYPDGIRSFQADETPIYAGICSIPERESQLESVIAGLRPQVDHIHVYLDRYPNVPSFLKQPDITVLRSQDQEVHHRDNAKFLPYNGLKERGGDFYYITADDDLVYPPDYVRTLVEKINHYDRKAVIGVHGVVLEEFPKGYFGRRFIHHFRIAHVAEAKLVNNLGTGTIGFHSSIFPSLDPKRWPMGGMADIFFSIEARTHGVPMISMERRPGWITDQAAAADSPRLYHEFKDKDHVITAYLSAHAPWGYKAILKTLGEMSPPNPEKLSVLLPLFAEHVSVESTFARLRS